MGLAELLRPLAVGEVVGGLVDARAHQRGPRAARSRPTGPRRSSAAPAGPPARRCEVEAGADVGDGERNAIGRFRPGAGHRQTRPDIALDHEIEAAAAGIGAGLASKLEGSRPGPAADCAHAARPAAAYPGASSRRVGSSPAPRRHRPTTLPDTREVGRVLEIEPDAALVAVPQHRRVRSLPSTKAAAPRGGVRLAGFRSSDDVGAEIAELHTR